MVTGEVRRVADAILEQIMSGAYPPGLRIPSEAELATHHACGRSTVREALRHLTGLGVVRSKKGSGAVVLDYRVHGSSMALLKPWLASGQFGDVEVLARELLQNRTHLACEGARLAASYAPADGLDEARRLVEHSKTLESDAVAHARNDLELHRALISASGFWPAVWLFNALLEPLVELSLLLPPLAIVPPQYTTTMTELLDRVAARDAEGATALLREHLDAIDRDILGAIVPIARAFRIQQGST